jgi:Tol biopolymer transport system component
MFASERAMNTVWNVYWCWTEKTGINLDMSLFLGNETSGTSSFSFSSSSAASFSPDGKRVAFCRNGDLWMATIDASAIHDTIGEASWDEARVLTCGIQEGGTRTSNETSTILRISWSRDGKLLALSTDRYGSTGSPQVSVVNAEKPTEKLFSFAGSEACFLDSENVLYVKPYTSSQDIWVRNLASRDERILIGHASEPSVVAKP